MKPYHKIPSIFKRDDRGKFTKEYSTPELNVLKDIEWQMEEKLDGTNIRIMWDGETVRFGGKTDNAQIPVPLLNVLQDTFPSEKFAGFEGGGCLYGEGIGPKIQKSGHLYGDLRFVLFDVRIDQWWLKREVVADIAEKAECQLSTIIANGPLQKAVDLAKEGFESRHGEFLAEGLVLRPPAQLFDRTGERIITKVKHKDFR